MFRFKNLELIHCEGAIDLDKHPAKLKEGRQYSLVTQDLDLSNYIMPEAQNII